MGVILLIMLLVVVYMIYRNMPTGIYDKRDSAGNLHCSNGPAWSYKGTKEYRIHGKLHRVGGPAVILGDGSQFWYQDGLFHREDGPAIIDSTGKSYYIHGKLHRENGPASVYSNGKIEIKGWYQNGLLHRENGPALILEDGTQRWYINGKEYSKEEYLAIFK